MHQFHQFVTQVLRNITVSDGGVSNVAPWGNTLHDFTLYFKDIERRLEFSPPPPDKWMHVWNDNGTGLVLPPTDDRGEELNFFQQDRMEQPPSPGDTISRMDAPQVASEVKGQVFYTSHDSTTEPDKQMEMYYNNFGPGARFNPKTRRNDSGRFEKQGFYDNRGMRKLSGHGRIAVSTIKVRISSAVLRKEAVLSVMLDGISNVLLIKGTDNRNNVHLRMVSV